MRTNAGIRSVQHRSGTGKSAETGSLLRCQNLVAGQSGPGYNSRRHAGQNASGNDAGEGSKQSSGGLAGAAGDVWLCVNYKTLIPAWYQSGTGPGFFLYFSLENQTVFP